MLSLKHRMIMLIYFILTFSINTIECLGPNDYDPFPYSAPDDAYPTSALRCYSSMTSPDNILICPESQNMFCIKEMVELKEDLCGKTRYFGDVYDRGTCTLRKCSRNCTDDFRYTFTHGPYTYARHTFCCKDDLCNTASSIQNNYLLYNICITVFMILILLF